MWFTNLNQKNLRILRVQRTEQLWMNTTNATQRKRLERFNNDSFEWATTSTNIFLKYPKKINKKNKNILAFQWQKRVIALALFVHYSLYTSLSRWPYVLVDVFIPVVQNFKFQRHQTCVSGKMIMAFVPTKEIYIYLHFSSNIYMLLSCVSNIRLVCLV